MISAYRDMLAGFAFTFLYLVSLGHSAPLACEDLSRPLDQLNPQHLQGRWTLVAGSNNPPLTPGELKDLRSGSMALYFSNTSETSVYSYTQANRVDDECYYLSYNLSIENSTFTSNLSWYNLTWSILNTSCSDCLVIRWALKKAKSASVDLFVYLFSRRRELEQKEMEEFRAQLECLKMPSPKKMDPTKELCPQPITTSN